MTAVVPDVALLADLRIKAGDNAKTIANFLTAHELGDGCATMIEPLSDGLTLFIGLTVEAYRKLGWDVVSHSAAPCGQGPNRSPMILVSLMLRRGGGKQLVHIG